MQLVINVIKLRLIRRKNIFHLFSQSNSNLFSFVVLEYIEISCNIPHNNIDMISTNIAKRKRLLYAIVF